MLNLLAETKKKNFSEQKQAYMKYRKVKIEFFCSEENMADPFTKNLSNGPFESLTPSYVYHELD